METQNQPMKWKWTTEAIIPINTMSTWQSHTTTTILSYISRIINFWHVRWHNCWGCVACEAFLLLTYCRVQYCITVSESHTSCLSLSQCFFSYLLSNKFFDLVLPYNVCLFVFLSCTINDSHHPSYEWDVSRGAKKDLYLPQRKGQHPISKHIWKAWILSSMKLALFEVTRLPYFCFR